MILSIGRCRLRLSTAAAVLALVMLANCGGDSDDEATRASTTTSGAGASSSTIAGGSAPVGGATTTTAAPAGVSSSTRARGGAAAQATPTTSSGGKAAASPSPGVAATLPGRYRYASTGTFAVGLGGEQRRSGESVLTVDPPAGADQHSIREGEGRVSEQIVRFQPDGAYLVMLKVTEQGLTKEFRPPSPVLAVPGAAAPGRTWSWRVTSTDGKTTLDASFRAERREAVSVGADTLEALVVQATLVTSGDLASRGTQTLWVAESRRLVVREQAATEGTFGAFSFRSTSDERLISLTPG